MDEYNVFSACSHSIQGSVMFRQRYLVLDGGWHLHCSGILLNPANSTILCYNTMAYQKLSYFFSGASIDVKKLKMSFTTDRAILMRRTWALARVRICQVISVITWIYPSLYLFLSKIIKNCLVGPVSLLYSFKLIFKKIKYRSQFKIEYL